MKISSIPYLMISVTYGSLHITSCHFVVDTLMVVFFIANFIHYCNQDVVQSH